MSAFGYNMSYEATCMNYTLREQASWDFVICESNKGWPAAHITLPLVTYLFLQHFWVAWAIPGLFEAFEITMLLFFGDFVFFDTLDVERETLAGSLLGDWIFNGTIGVLLAVLLVRQLKLPHLLPRTVDHPDRDPTYVRALRWRYFCFWLLFVINNVMIGWVLPTDCLRHLPRDCTNIGLMVSTAVQAWLFYCLHWLHRDDPLVWGARAGPHGYVNQRWSFTVIWFVIFTIHLQNFQPFIPHYLGVGGGFTQPWLVSALWLLLLGATALHDEGATAWRWCRARARIVQRACAAPRIFCCCSYWACCRCAAQEDPLSLSAL